MKISVKKILKGIILVSILNVCASQVQAMEPHQQTTFALFQFSAGFSSVSPGPVLAPPPPAYTAVPNAPEIDLVALQLRRNNLLLAQPHRESSVDLIEAIGANKTVSKMLPWISAGIFANALKDFTILQLQNYVTFDTIRNTVAVETLIPIMLLLATAYAEGQLDKKECTLITLLRDLDDMPRVVNDAARTHPLYTLTRSLVHDSTSEIHDPFAHHQLSERHQEYIRTIHQLEEIGALQARSVTWLFIGSLFMINVLKDLAMYSTTEFTNVAGAAALASAIGSLISVLKGVLTMDDAHKKKESFKDLLSQLDEFIEQDEQV